MYNWDTLLFEPFPTSLPNPQFLFLSFNKEVIFNLSVLQAFFFHGGLQIFRWEREDVFDLKGTLIWSSCIAFPCLPLPLASSTKCRCHQLSLAKGNKCPIKYLEEWTDSPTHLLVLNSKSYISEKGTSQRLFSSKWFPYFTCSQV